MVGNVFCMFMIIIIITVEYGRLVGTADIESSVRKFQPHGAVVLLWSVFHSLNR